MPDRDHSWHLRRAQRLLVETGNELPGTEVSLFVVRLLHGLDAGQDDAQNIDAALAEVSDGPMGLVAGEPDLHLLRLATPATTTGEAADQALRLFATAVLDRQRRDPVVPSEPPTPEVRARLREQRRARDAPDAEDLRARVAVQTARLASPRWTERANAAAFLGRFAVVEARPSIERLLDDPYPEVAESAAAALRALPASAADAAPPPAPELPDFGTAYAAMDGQDAMAYVDAHFDAVAIDLETWETRYRDPTDGALWTVDFPDATRPGGGLPRVRRTPA